MITAVHLGLIAIFGGKERDYAEFQFLFQEAGLMIKNHQEIIPMLHVMQCQKN